MPHLLKRLELNGFKSFAQKTAFDLSEGITAIVGPNGSGKSNIIDGVRWLLGEREARNLRGAKTEDLIFAGTPKKPRMSQASASLYFENRGGFFPVDFPEIVVSRQVSRDGVNQYFLNKSSIRLKDLIDFFAKARLGVKGLVVIAQGNSDVFIQSTPPARREMIEEMLGLREYQIKRSDAEKRLKKTQINLDKAKALIDEILPHLRSLRRQTKRWEKREVLAGELRQLENQFFGGEWVELREKLAEADKNIDIHKKHLAALEKEKKTAEENLTQVEASQPEEKKELQAIKAETQGLLDKKSELQKELGRLEAQMEAVQNAMPAAVPRAGELLEFLKKVRVKLEICLDEPDKIDETLNQLLEDIETVLAEHSSSAQAKDLPQGLRQQFEKIRQELGELEKNITSLRDKDGGLDKKQERFYGLFKAAVAELEAAKDKVERWQNEHQKLLFERERLELRQAEWERQVRQAERDPREFEKIEIKRGQDYDYGATEKKIFRLHGELASMGEVDEALVKEARSTEERYEFLKKESADLDRARTDLKKLITDLSDKIRTEFGGALGKINQEFDKFFSVMFGGGHAKLKIVKLETRSMKQEDSETQEGGPIEGETKQDSVEVLDLEEEPEEGIEIDVKLPRKRITSLDMLSGGERSLVGIAALFAMISVSPPPFLVLDEIDAALDERNARRFAEMLKDFSKKIQFVIVTHNRATMEVADVLYGVTMNDDGTSKVLSLKLERAEQPLYEKGHRGT